MVGIPLFSKKSIKNLFVSRDPALEEYKHLLVRKEEVLLSIKELDFDLETGYKKLYLGSDHLGMRPLFYTIYKNSLLFC